MNWNMGWKTLLGSVLVATGTLLSGPIDAEHIMQAAGIVLAAIGVRSAIKKGPQ